MSPAKRRGLGRGLDALLTTVPNVTVDDNSSTPEHLKNELEKLPVEQLQPGKYQPRKDMSAEALEDLANSIRSQGIIQPIVVRTVGNDSYEIIAGERRWRAARIAGIDIIPCIIKNVPDETAIAIALIENIQREDLNAMEEAVALNRLLNEFELTHKEVAQAVGKSRAAVSNLIRLNNLNEDVKILLEHGDIEMGHARALLALDGDLQTASARIVAAKELTVRETEVLVKRALEPITDKQEKIVNIEDQSLEKKLTEVLGQQVVIKHNTKGKGKLTISYNSLVELDGIIGQIS
jgi:ParB family chromosome partitioning protein|tara:strand:+ start:5425 stop:6303 length:879 start_codon:yes stop_codon:yes gene_type:complete